MSKNRKEQDEKERQEGEAAEAQLSELSAETEKSEQKAEEGENAAKQELERVNAQAEDFKRKWYSVTAEYENYRKRTAQTRVQAYAEGRADVVAKLFPIADNLERALASCKDESVKKGIEMVCASFNKLLEEEKIETIDPVGATFDPELCEAIMAQDPEEGEESGVVKQVFRKGYRQNGKVLRFAQVLVTK